MVLQQALYNRHIRELCRQTPKEILNPADRVRNKPDGAVQHFSLPPSAEHNRHSVIGRAKKANW